MAVAQSGLTPVEPEVSVAPDNAMTVAYAKVDAGGAGRGLHFRTYRVVKPPGSCIADSATCCLNDNRFQVRVSWEDFDGRTGVGAARPLTDDTGTFWFFNDANIDLVLTVLDDTAINGHHWVFYGALSNVGYTLTVTDTLSGEVKSYFNPSGTFASVGDTEAFADPSVCPSAARSATPRRVDPQLLASALDRLTRKVLYLNRPLHEAWEQLREQLRSGAAPRRQ